MADVDMLVSFVIGLPVILVDFFSIILAAAYIPQEPGRGLLNCGRGLLVALPYYI